MARLYRRRRLRRARARPLIEELELTGKERVAAGRAVARHAAEGGHRLRPGARRDDAAVRRAADRTRSARHPADARHDRRARARRRGDPAVVAPAAPGRGGLHARHHHGPRPQGGRRHVRGARVARRSRAGRLEPRADLPARDRARRRRRSRGRDVGASLYIIVCSAKNRMRAAAAAAARAAISARRDRRRRVSLLHVLRAAARRRARGATARAAPAPMLAGAAVAAWRRGPALAGLALLLVAALRWMLPFDSGLLDFSEAEMQFLFPAPVSRRAAARPPAAAVAARRCCSARSIVAVVAAVGGRLRAAARRRSRCGCSWSTAKVYFTGVSLARARLGVRRARARGASRGCRSPCCARRLRSSASRWCALVARRRRRAMRTRLCSRRRRRRRGAAAHRAVAVHRAGAAAVRRVAGAVPASRWLALRSCWLRRVAWVLQSDEAFQDAAAERRASAAAERARPRTRRYRVRSSGWTLAPPGRPEEAFAWKAAMQTLRVVDRARCCASRASLIAVGVVAASMAVARERRRGASSGASRWSAAAFARPDGAAGRAHRHARRTCGISSC